MAKIKCPKCRSTNVSIVAMKTQSKLNLNPFKPLTVFNQVPKKKQNFHCQDCGKVFEHKI